MSFASELDNAILLSMTQPVAPRASQDADPVSFRYLARYIVLSYFISWIGCITTLELLQRRTSRRGAYNWYLLVASSISMGGVGIWCMHFIGNRAIVLAGPPDRYHLFYNEGFTALSFFLPIIVLLIAFHLLTVAWEANNAPIVLAGFLTGTAVCAMHYVGQLGITNYSCTYKTANIVGAAIIAIAASLIALSIFFRLRKTWTDSWWKRCLCAALLASAVSGMHWTASVGTVYRLKNTDRVRGQGSRVQTIIVCAVLSFAACLFLLGTTLFAHRRHNIRQKRAQELVLACAYFDESGRLMVDRNSNLPYQKITDNFVGKTFKDEELNRSHPAFTWVYQVSRNWTTVQELITGVENSPNPGVPEKKRQSEHTTTSDLDRTTSVEFNTVFKQLFCVAAQRLAYQIHEPIDRLGKIFEEPLETGSQKTQGGLTRELSVRNMATRPSKKHRNTNDAPKALGKGRYLFLVRQLDKSEAANYAALGCRFGSVAHVAELLARSMQVNQDKLTTHFERMRISSSTEHLHPSGVHLACFVVRPSIATRFDILVPALKQNQLPLITLPITKVTKFHEQILQSFDELTVRDILKDLIDENVAVTEQERDFRWQLHNAFVRLIDLTADSETMMQARFSARPVQAPCRSSLGSNTPSTCSLLSVRLLGTIHSTSRHKQLTYVPLNFFTTQQHVKASEGATTSLKTAASADSIHKEGFAHEIREHARSSAEQDEGTHPLSTDREFELEEHSRAVDASIAESASSNHTDRTFVHDLFLLFGLSKA